MDMNVALSYSQLKDIAPMAVTSCLSESLCCRRTMTTLDAVLITLNYDLISWLALPNVRDCRSFR